MGRPGLRRLRSPRHHCPQRVILLRLASLRSGSPSFIRSISTDHPQRAGVSAGPRRGAPGPGVRGPSHLWDTWGGEQDGGLRGCGAPAGLRGPAGASVTQSDDGPVVTSTETGVKAGPPGPVHPRRIGPVLKAHRAPLGSTGGELSGLWGRGAFEVLLGERGHFGEEGAAGRSEETGAESEHWGTGGV